MKTEPHDREPRYAKHLSRLIRPFPNFDFFFIKNVRASAVSSLQLQPGSRVLDLGCGGGGSFPYLVKAVGSTGLVVGIDVSPQSCMNARLRVKSNQWQNVQVLESPAETAQLTGAYDGALMFAAPDVFASESAIANILPRLNHGARIAFFGAKTSYHRFGRLLNPVLRFLASKLSPQTPLPSEAPWSLLSKHLDGFQIREYAFGSMFLASGELKQHAQAPNNSFKPKPASRVGLIQALGG